MAVRAKFSVVSRTERGYAPRGVSQVDVELSAAYCGRKHATVEEEDACESHSYSEATPQGKLVLTITNPRAYEQFRVGDVFYLDFIKADG